MEHPALSSMPRSRTATHPGAGSAASLLASHSMRRFAVLGHPVEHSLSPRIHGEFYRRHGLEAEYGRLDVPPDALPARLSGLAAYAGLNVTFPHKVEIAKACRTLSEDARALAAVNTLVPSEVMEPGIPFAGHNTDGEGLCAYLERELALELAGARVLVLGAGATARSVVLALRRRSVREVVVANRGPERFSETFWREQPVRLTTDADAELPLAGLVIHATTFGLAGQTAGPVPWRLERLAPAATVDGKGMLIFQAAEAFRLWWGFFPDVTGMVGWL
jgi:shikimate dehydrogenase